ncbi:LysE family translocator [Undibacterium sp.]|jgi:homoserine/homoserine lactone efflux protein|uniref:LysE family translocator n=1 Tax=Undibacterium sp. TaxID=1914977 RepID=UPI002B834D46|nr:LysE family translocator [Undibacterium sp.]HTD04312.1 LysE family translocator [Undibacterium sp.]
MSWDAYLIFIVTTGVICLTPGPAALLIVAQGMSNGMRRSYWAIAGIAVANAIYFALSATGIAALIVASGTLFSIIKWGGVAYLFYLGVSALMNKAGAFTVTQDQRLAVQGPRAFWHAVIVELSNPKALLYFVALLPQFIDPAQPIGRQMLIYGVSCIVLDGISYSLYAWLGSKTRRFTASTRFVKRSNRASGSLLIIAGALMAGVKRAIH